MKLSSRFFAVLKRIGCVAATAGAALVVGCQPDHRMSLAQFMETQKTAAEPAGDAAAQPTGDLDRQLGPYKVGPGDVLNVTLTGTQPEVIPAVHVRVDREGNIDMPIVGAVQVGGMELEQVEDRIRQAYVPKVYSEVVAFVELSAADTTSVLVVGAVTTPGLVQLRRTDRDMLHAIVVAGGVSSDASGVATLRRIRRPGETATFDLKDAARLRDALTLPPLENGDVLTVHAAQPNTIYVGGLVNRAIPQIYPHGARVTALQALAGASGLRTDVAPKDATLVRRLPDGTDAHVRLDLNRMASGADPNPTLMAGDILWVPETLETRVQDFVNRNIFFRAGVSVNYNVTAIDFINRHEMQGARFGGGSTTLQDSFDPLGFLQPNTVVPVGGN